MYTATVAPPPLTSPSTVCSLVTICLVFGAAFSFGSESWGTFGYMTEQSHWNWAVQQSVRLAGAVLMWKVGQGMPKKYNIEGDLREALYADANSFVAAVGNKKFLGGDKPNLADLAVFGVLQAIRGTDTYNDVVLNSNIGQWLSRMVLAVGDSCEVKQVPGKETAAAA